MNPKELDKIITTVAMDEVKKLISEQISSHDKTTDKVKSFQTLSTIKDKITNVENPEEGIIKITIEGVSEDEIISCCGGENIQMAQAQLMQGIHHDIEESGMGDDCDVEVNMEGTPNSLTVNIVIRMGVNDMVMDDDITEKQEILLGNKKGLNENKKMKRKVRLSEGQMNDLLTKIVTEASKMLDATTDKALTDSDKDNKDHLAMVEKKIKKYLSFKGNDNPEFPNQIGVGEKKIARQNNEEQEQEIDDNRGRGPQDLDYDNIDDNTPNSPKFQERLEMSIVGDSKMGNSPDAGNAIKTDTGEKILKNMKRRKDIRKEKTIYKKEPVPVTTSKTDPISESKQDDGNLIKEISRMKDMFKYDKKTQ